jgi:hypothetical protein
MCNDSFSTSDYVASNYFWLIEENYMYKDFIKLCPSIHLDGLKKTAENLSHNGRSLGGVLYAQMGGSMLKIF